MSLLLLVLCTALASLIGWTLKWEANEVLALWLLLLIAAFSLWVWSTKPSFSVVKGNARWVIAGTFLVVAVLLHSCSTRYYYIRSENRVLDRWTGKTHAR